MTKSEMVARLESASAWVPGKRIKIDFGAEGIFLIDGVDRRIAEHDGAADTVISVSWDDLKALERRELDPMTALIQGRLRVEGDMAGALQLQGLIAQLRA